MAGGQRAAIVFAGASLRPTPRLRSRLSNLERPFVVAADGGAATSLLFGLQPNVVIGDLDSLEAATLVELQRRGVPVEAYPREKDATDGQLALLRALEVGPDRVWLLGFLGGARLDQTLANILLLVRSETSASMLDEHNECTLLRPGVEHAWTPEAGEIISLLPLAGDVGGVRTRGLRWSLDGQTLHLGDTRGVSNESVSTEVRVSIASGLLVVTRHFQE